ncbi:acyl n-acyltransferase [Fusarium phyllophilum]|uniref:Acyl n-acyltransferase n=1 Tax=Fusarium phyllophilum TaxID=47803 RepID=A0A8H5NL11_9HYPO|nr:acyl n-acyltransferase [Fusarium phyllophilum]
MALPEVSDSLPLGDKKLPDGSQDLTASQSPYHIEIFTGQELLDSSVLRELQTVINAAYQSHDNNPLGAIGERIQHDTQIVDEIGTNGFTVVMSCADEIVGTASVKNWKPSIQENDWKPAGHYAGRSADEASAMDAVPSIPEAVSCEGDVEVFMVAVKPGLQYRKKGVAEGLLRACEQQLKKQFGPKTDPVRVILRVVREINSQYWLKKGYRIIGERYYPPLTWDVEKAFILLAMRKDIR